MRQSEVDRLSHQEGSAGLANHALAWQRIGDGLRRLRAEHQQLIVLFIDLGLQPGTDDDALQEIMGRLAAVIRATDTVTAVGGGRIVLTAETRSSGLPSPADILRDRCGRADSDLRR